jgi:hypothetical protein
MTASSQTRVQGRFQGADTSGTDVGEHRPEVVRDVGGEAADAGGRPLDRPHGPVGLCPQRHHRGVVVAGQYQQRGVALVLQVVHQDRQLLAQIRELRHPGELRRVALGVVHPQSAEDQPHQQCRDDNGE